MKQITKFALPVLFAAFIMLCGMTTATRAQEDDNYPKPDFTEFEKWYEVVKFEYNIHYGKVYLTVKAKKESHMRPHKWDLEWLDADGVRIVKYNFVGLNMAEVGKPYRAYTLSPTEGEMDRLVKSVKLIRNKE